MSLSLALTTAIYIETSEALKIQGNFGLIYAAGGGGEVEPALSSSYRTAPSGKFARGGIFCARARECGMSTGNDERFQLFAELEMFRKRSFWKSYEVTGIYLLILPFFRVVVGYRVLFRLLRIFSYIEVLLRLNVLMRKFYKK